MSRRWTIAIDLEQIWFSFQDQHPPESITWSPTSRLLLSGDWDNYNPNAIFNSTIDVVRLIRRRPGGVPGARGKAEFWSDTGHSFHNERPRLFAEEIVYFFTNPDAGDSPNGVIVSTPQRAQYTETQQRAATETTTGTTTMSFSWSGCGGARDTVTTTTTAVRAEPVAAVAAGNRVPPLPPSW